VIWTSDEEKLLGQLRPYCTTREIAQIFQRLGHDRGMKAISDKSRRKKIKFLEHGTPDLSSFSEGIREIVQIVLQEREEFFDELVPEIPPTPSQKATITRTTNQSFNHLYTELIDLRQSIPKSSPCRPKKSSKKSCCLLLSDFHIGKRVQDLNGEHLYNMEIGLSRLKRTPSLLLSKLPDPTEIDELVVLLIGDHIDGEGIYPSQEIIVETHAFNQVKPVARVLWQVLQELLQTFPSLRVITTRGNHGRTGQSKESNWDNALFFTLEIMADMEGDPNLSIKNYFKGHSTFEVKGWKGLIRHWAPLQIETAAGRARISGWEYMHNFDIFCTGHWHHPSWQVYHGKSVFRNGSLIGKDEYSEELGLGDPPCQLAFTVDETSPHLATYILEYD
jgi:hypothetical protein